MNDSKVNIIRARLKEIQHKQYAVLEMLVNPKQFYTLTIGFQLQTQLRQQRADTFSSRPKTKPLYFNLSFFPGFNLMTSSL